MSNHELEIFGIENHDQLYDIWKEQDTQNLRLSHVDFHCDLRGLMIDRANQLAYKIPDVRRGVDMGNFLSHAVNEGRIKSIEWVHGSPGGRSCDVHTVKYTNDVSSLFYNCAVGLHWLQPIPLEYTVISMDAWQGPKSGVFLDIDWDVFVDREIRRDELDWRVAQFFEKHLTVPLSGMSICYSPSHSHDTRAEF